MQDGAKRMGQDDDLSCPAFNVLAKELVVILRPGVNAHVCSEIGKAVDQELNRVLRIVSVKTAFFGHQLVVVRRLQ